MERKKILSALVAGLVFGSMVAEPIASYAAEAANGSENVLNVNSTAKTYYEQGEKLYNEGKYEEAANFFKKAAEEAKTNDAYWADCGAAYYMAESYQHATEYFEKAIKLNPSKANNYAWCSLCWLQRGIHSSQDKSRMFGFGKPIWDFFKKACEYADHAASMAPDDSNIQASAGNVAAIAGNYAKAYGIRRQTSPEKLYQIAYNRIRKAVELDQNNETAQNYLSNFLKIHPEYGSMSPVPSVQGGAGTQTVTANGDYGFVQTLGNGPVQFVPRMVHKPPTQPAVGDGITRSYVSGVPAGGIRCLHGEFIPPVAPGSGKPLYIIYRNMLYDTSAGWGKRKTVSENWLIGIFSYDDETDTFTLYESSTPYKTMHIVDKNQIEIERWSSSTGVSQDNPEHFIVKYEKAVISSDWDGAPNRPCDTDGYGWMLIFEDAPEEYQTEVGGWDWLTASIDAQNGGISYANEVGVDGLFVFLARKGQVGYAPPANDNVEYINKAGADFGASTGHLKYN